MSKENGTTSKGVKDRILDLEKTTLGLHEAYAKLATNYNTLLQTLDKAQEEQEGFKQQVSVTTESMAALVRMIRDESDFTEKNMTTAVSLNQEDRLVQQTQDMVNYGVLKEVDLVAEKDSYIVGKEIDDKGAVIARRTQFPLAKITEDLKSQFIGKKVGDEIVLKEGNTIQIVKIYDIVEPEETSPEKGREPEKQSNIEEIANTTV